MVSRQEGKVHISKVCAFCISGWLWLREAAWPCMPGKSCVPCRQLEEPCEHARALDSNDIWLLPLAVEVAARQRCAAHNNAGSQLLSRARSSLPQLLQLAVGRRSLYADVRSRITERALLFALPPLLGTRQLHTPASFGGAPSAHL